MLIKRKPDVTEAQVTDKSVYLSRRELISSTVGVAALSTSTMTQALVSKPQDAEAVTGAKWLKDKVVVAKESSFSTSESLTPYRDVTQYNNFYEFGTQKTDPARYQNRLNVDPWKVEVSGEAEKTGTFNLEDLLKEHLLEERIYRLRCVEAWSMVIPWIGIPLSKLLKDFKPNSKAKFVEFTTLQDSKQMPGQRAVFSTIDWPYVEGLRIDEAMNPLTLMAVGLYGDVLPTQNGAPFRLIVPWKYGFKSIKSIVKIRFVDKMPLTTWAALAPSEYGFYANVNPSVDHPRWSQASERRLPSGLFSPNRIKTQPFNGYAEQVSGLYQGMDLQKFY